MGGIRHKIGVYISIILVIFFLLCKFTTGRTYLFLFFVRIQDIIKCIYVYMYECRDILILVILYYGGGSCECRDAPN